MRAPALPLSGPGRGSLAAVASAALLSTTAILVRHLTITYHMPALVLAFWRDAFVVAVLLLVLGRRRHAPQGRHLPRFAAFGAVLAAFNGLWSLSVALNGAAVATVLVYSSAAFTAVLGWRFLGERAGAGQAAAVASTLAGCALVAGVTGAAAGRLTSAGVATGVASGLAYAVYTLLGRASVRLGLDPWTTLLYTFGTAALCLLAANLAPGAAGIPGAAPRPTGLLCLGGAVDAWAALLLLAAGPTVMGFGLYNVSLTRLTAGTANLVLTLEPVFTAALAFLLLGERLAPGQLAGAALILGGVAALCLLEGARLPGAAAPRRPGHEEAVPGPDHRRRAGQATAGGDHPADALAGPPQHRPRRDREVTFEGLVLQRPRQRDEAPQPTCARKAGGVCFQRGRTRLPRAGA